MNGTPRESQSYCWANITDTQQNNSPPDLMSGGATLPSTVANDNLPQWVLAAGKEEKRNQPWKAHWNDNADLDSSEGADLFNIDKDTVCHGAGSLAA